MAAITCHSNNKWQENYCLIRDSGKEMNQSSSRQTKLFAAVICNYEKITRHLRHKKEIYF